ncbi:ATP-binding protein [Anaerobiospirillum thomasii]|nr:ATP-binding protein [Anaerobiospirillum thomasii]
MEQEVLKSLRGLKLVGFSEALLRQLQQPEIYNKINFMERISIAVQEHIDYLHMKKSQTILKKSRLKGIRTIDTIDAEESRGLSASLIAELTTLGFETKHQNIIIRGASGTGKTELVCALGRLACSRAISTEYYTASDLMELCACMNIEERHRLRERLKKIKILIIDDLFLTEFQNSDYAKYLHDILDDRINVGSTIFATQLADSGIAARVDNIGSAVADALVRRIKNCAFDIVLKPFVDPLATLKDSKNV